MISFEQIIMALTDSNMPLQDTLLKIKVLASKVNNDDLMNFVKNELEGYDSNIPKYRKYQGQLIGHIANCAAIHKNKTLPINHLDAKTRKILTTCEFSQSVGALSEYLNIDGDLDLQKPIPMEFYKLLSKPFNGSFHVQSACIPIDKGIIGGILTNIRSKLLDLMLEVEKSFSEGDVNQLFIKPDEDTKNKVNNVINHYIKNEFNSSNDSRQDIKIELESQSN